MFSVSQPIPELMRAVLSEGGSHHPRHYAFTKLSDANFIATATNPGQPGNYRKSFAIDTTIYG